jgi:hypothetical protein
MISKETHKKQAKKILGSCAGKTTPKKWMESWTGGKKETVDGVRKK